MKKNLSKTKVERKLSRKTNAGLVKLVINVKKVNLPLANLLAAPKRKRTTINLEKISKETKENEIVIVPGKVLGNGKMEHSITIAALFFSSEALKKLKEAKCKIETIEGVLHHKPLKIIK